MSNSPSYNELKESENFWLTVTPYTAELNETLDGFNEDEPISSSIYYETDLTSIEDSSDYPFKELRIEVLELSSEEIQSFSGKYPIGFIQFWEESASATLMCRNELVSRMVSTIHMVRNREIEFFITLPVLPNELPSIFPILNFQYRVRSISKA